MLKNLNLDNDAPWKARFRSPKIMWAALAKENPKRGLVCTNQSGVLQLYGWDVASGQLSQVTDKAAGVVFGSLSSDGRYVYYLEDKQGDEIGHFVRVPFEGGAAEDITPDLSPYASFSLTESAAGNRLGFVQADKEGFRVLVIDKTADGSLATPRVLWQSKARSHGPTFSDDGAIAVVSTTERTGKNELSLIALDAVTGAKLGELYDEDGSVSPVSFAPQPGDSRLLANSDVSGYTRPLIWDVSTGQRFDLPAQDFEGDVSAWNWSPDGKRVLLCQLNKAQYQLYIYNLETEKLTILDHPSGTIGGFFGGFFAPNNEIFVTWQDAANPSRLVALDGNTGEMVRTVLTAGDAPGGRPWRSVTFPSTGGVEVQAWVAVPEGEGPFPMILHTHGGPTGVTTEVFDSPAQAWLDHGFAWMSVNYRGSITFGKDFERAIWGNLGQVEVDDMAAARDWAVENKIADPDSILLTGWSYGGYLTLQGLGRRPDLWAGGMGGIAIADWVLMYEDQAETLRGYQRSLFGGTPEETPEAHKSASPITYAEQIKAPLLVIQGSNDTRCPARQMQAYEQKLQSLGKDIHIHWFDAGHGSRDNEQQIEHQEIMLRFAYRVLG